MNVTLRTKDGEWLRDCPLGALEALATVRQHLEPYARLTLSDDQRTIRARYGSGDRERVYVYRVEPER